MKIKVEIKRQESKESIPYYEHFYVDVNKDTSVIMILREINLQHKNNPIVFEESCHQKQCGSCAMVINGVPGLACGTFIRELFDLEKTSKELCLKIEPLSKFPVVRDLRVDRTAMYEAVREMKLWIDSIKDSKQLAKYNQMLFDSASCLMCGCCLEVCPNYYDGGKFYGASTMLIANRMILTEANQSKRKQLKRENRKHGSNRCSKSLGCEKVCPMNLPFKLHISRLSTFCPY